MKVGDTVWTIAAGGPSPRTIARIYDDGIYSIKGEFNCYFPDAHFPTEVAAWQAYRNAMLARLNDLGKQTAVVVESLKATDARLAELAVQEPTP